MTLQMIASNSFELWTMVFFLVIGISFLLFSHKAELLFAGVVALGGVVMIAYNNHSHYLSERFVLQQFHEGSALACGMWRGEGARVDRLKGWQYQEGVGFVKDDIIINDPSVCRVIDKPFPEPSSVPYWMGFVSGMGIIVLLRFATQGRVEEKESDTHEEENNAETAHEGERDDDEYRAK
jgi:hypothetical protein